MNVVFVQRAVANARHEALPDPRLFARLQLVRVLVPEIEIADDADRVGVGRPDRESRPLRLLRQVRAHLLVEVAVGALVEKMQVERGEQRGRDHAGAMRSRMPRSGMRTQSGLVLSS